MGVSDGNINLGLLYLVILSFIMWFFSYYLYKIGYKIKVGRFPLKGSGKAVALGDTEGLIKTIIDEDNGALLGAHMIGPEVTEMIHGYALARNAEMTEAEIIETVFPHPTLSEAMHEAVLDAYGRVIHF